MRLKFEVAPYFAPYLPLICPLFLKILLLNLPLNFLAVPLIQMWELGTCHMLCVTCHMSLVTRYMLYTHVNSWGHKKSKNIG